MVALLVLACADPATTDDPATTATTATTPVTEPEDTGVADTGTPASGCPAVGPQTVTAVISDIDETLTTSDGEWLTQIVNPFHDPEMRPYADTVMRGYLAKGYRIFYITSRGEGLFLLDGTSAREATVTWLESHDFPYTADGVFMATGIGALGGEAADYKTGVLEALKAQGFELVYAYGNADTDIEAYHNAGLNPDQTFLVGSLAGQLPVMGLTDAEAYTDHLDYVAAVPCGH